VVGELDDEGEKGPWVIGDQRGRSVSGVRIPGPSKDSVFIRHTPPITVLTKIPRTWNAQDGHSPTSSSPVLDRAGELMHQNTGLSGLRSFSEVLQIICIQGAEASKGSSVGGRQGKADNAMDV